MDKKGFTDLTESSKSSASIAQSSKLWVVTCLYQERSGLRISACVPSMALILLVQVQLRVFTAKCSEPQVGTSNGMEGGSGTYGSMGGAKIFIFPLPYYSIKPCQLA